MGEKCPDDIDAVFDLNRLIRDFSLAQFILAINVSVGRAVFSHAPLPSFFKIVMGETASFKMSAC